MSSSVSAREAVTLARLNHPGIATLYELHRQDDELLMVMEFVRGETFHDLSDRLGAARAAAGGPPAACRCSMRWLTRTVPAWCIAISSRRT